jgi:cytochrome P450
LRERLREEVKPMFGETIPGETIPGETIPGETIPGETIPGEFTHQDVADLELLDAVIDETTRMHNPTCNNGARNVLPEGITVEGKFIPGGRTVFTGIDAHHHSKFCCFGIGGGDADGGDAGLKYFKQPNDFIPERWTTEA